MFLHLHKGIYLCLDYKQTKGTVGDNNTRKRTIFCGLVKVIDWLGWWRGGMIAYSWKDNRESFVSSFIRFFVAEWQCFRMGPLNVCLGLPLIWMVCQFWLQLRVGVEKDRLVGQIQIWLKIIIFFNMIKNNHFFYKLTIKKNNNKRENFSTLVHDWVIIRLINNFLM